MLTYANLGSVCHHHQCILEMYWQIRKNTPPHNSSPLCLCCKNLQILWIASKAMYNPLDICHTLKILYFLFVTQPHWKWRRRGRINTTIHNIVYHLSFSLAAHGFLLGISSLGNSLSSSVPAESASCFCSDDANFIQLMMLSLIQIVTAILMKSTSTQWVVG